MNLSRRSFVQLLLLSAGALAGIEGIRTRLSSWTDTRSLEVSEHHVPVRHLGLSGESLQVAHVSDVHLHTLGPLHEAIITAVRERDPELVVLTGDIINSEQEFALLQEFCRQLGGPGRIVVATMGNHEHRGRVCIARLREVYRRSGVQLLHNEALRLPSGLTLVGVGDYTTKQHDLRRAMRGLPAEGARLFLTHSPLLLDRLPPCVPRVDLALCGHTHGGQIRFGIEQRPLVANSGRFVAGFYAFRSGLAYVSRGIGTTLLPLRLNCPPELPFFRLVRASGRAQGPYGNLTSPEKPFLGKA
jgi:uncharacterized protein